MIIRVVAGKGGKDRDLPLSPTLLETLREYWRWRKSKLYLFPTRTRDLPVEEPISDKTVWIACNEAARRAGISKRVTRTRCATVGRLTCWKLVPTCGPSRSCLGTEIWRPLPSICICRDDTCRPSVIRW